MLLRFLTGRRSYDRADRTELTILEAIESQSNGSTLQFNRTGFAYWGKYNAVREALGLDNGELEAGMEAIRKRDGGLKGLSSLSLETFLDRYKENRKILINPDNGRYALTESGESRKAELEVKHSQGNS